MWVIQHGRLGHEGETVVLILTLILYNRFYSYITIIGLICPGQVSQVDCPWTDIDKSCHDMTTHGRNYQYRYVRIYKHY